MKILLALLALCLASGSRALGADLDCRSGALTAGPGCDPLRSTSEGLCRNDYMKIVDGQIDDEQRCASRTFFNDLAKDSNQLTLVLYFHGGLVDAASGIKGAIDLDPTFRIHPSDRADVVPYYFIYDVGPIDSVTKGDRERGLFHLYDNAQASLIDRITGRAGFTKARLLRRRGHDTVTDREDSMRLGFPPLAIVGRNGAYAWAYMKQVILDGLDMLDDYVAPPTPPASPQPAATPISGDPLIDYDRYPPDGQCLRPTQQELDPWPHIVRNHYQWERAGARDFLCRLGNFINRRGKINIVLIGHSTGAIYATQFIRKAHRLWTSGNASSQQFHLIFLAPAVSYQDFDRLLTEAPDRVQEMRVFTMDDDHERIDRVLAPVVGPFFKALAEYYDHSLLYAISGIFEPSPDEPILGMDRFLLPPTIRDIRACAGDDRTTVAQLMEIDQVQNFLNSRLGGTLSTFVFSPSPVEAKPPFASHAMRHGDFPTDPDTRDSLAKLVTETATGENWSPPSGADAQSRASYSATVPTPEASSCPTAALSNPVDVRPSGRRPNRASQTMLHS